MLDIETMGPAPHGAIIAIGALQFDLESGETGEEFETTVDLQSSLDAGLEVDGSTLSWWLDQENHVLDDMMAGEDGLTKALIKFDYFVNKKLNISQDNLVVWANPPSFDVVIMEKAFETVDFDAPWQYWNQRCLMTFASVFPDLKWDLKEEFEEDQDSDAHNALDDCYFQVELANQIHNKIHNN